MYAGLARTAGACERTAGACERTGLCAWRPGKDRGRERGGRWWRVARTTDAGRGQLGKGKRQVVQCQNDRETAGRCQEGYSRGAGVRCLLHVSSGRGLSIVFYYYLYI